jgi:nicotinamidase-related amidase
MPSNTAIIIIDPYNDFLHPNGKLNGLLAESLKETDTIKHLKEMVNAARQHKIPIYYGLHQQCKAGFIAGWNHATPLQKSQKENVAFEEGSWGVDIYEGLEPSLANGDVVVSKHWSSRYVLLIDDKSLMGNLTGWEARSIVRTSIISFDRGISRTL